MCIGFTYWSSCDAYRFQYTLTSVYGFYILVMWWLQLSLKEIKSTAKCNPLDLFKYMNWYSKLFIWCPLWNFTLRAFIRRFNPNRFTISASVRRGWNNISATPTSSMTLPYLRMLLTFMFSLCGTFFIPITSYLPRLGMPPAALLPRLGLTPTSFLVWGTQTVISVVLR